MAACDPCRSSKRRCDHELPACSRCRRFGQESKCIYRPDPFKKIRQRRSNQRIRRNASSAAEAIATYDSSETLSNKYPNPGYLGTSSSETIFGHLRTREGNVEEQHFREVRGFQVDDATIWRGVKLLKHARASLPSPSCWELVKVWMSKGVNLALAGSFTQPCLQTADEVLNATSVTADAMANVSKDLFHQSSKHLVAGHGSTIEDFCASFCRSNARWETLGIFFTALSRATFDLPSFEPLYTTSKGRRTFQRLTMQLSDDCLDLALVVDNMNDILLVLQYENFIAHSIIDGDQSHQSWRKLGDVISSLFALGYHEQADEDPLTPVFLQDLRRAAFARTYSADKNVAIFLGRPPRIHRKYCRFKLPGEREVGIYERSLPYLDPHGPVHEGFDYAADTRWSAMCAMHKEDILRVLQEGDLDKKDQSLSAIQIAAEHQWQSLPSQLRLEGPLKDYIRSPQERDLLVSTRLNHLHVMFLLRLAFVKRVTEPEAGLVDVSMSMLRIVIEAVLLRQQLANSGTGLIWKVAHYGLPAAGIICLSLLSKTSVITKGGSTKTQIFQDLSVFVAEVETGALAPFEDPNYALLSGAAGTIKTILSQVLNTDGAVATSSSAPEFAFFPAATWQDVDSMPGFFETDFWLGLSEHPSLVACGDTLPVTNFSNF